MAKTMYSLKLDPALRERLRASGIPIRKAVEEGIKVLENRGELAIAPPQIPGEPLPGQTTTDDVGTPPYYFFLDMAGASASLKKQLALWQENPSHRSYFFERYGKDGFTIQQMVDWVRLTESGAWKASLDRAKKEREDDNFINSTIYDRGFEALTEDQKKRVREIRADSSGVLPPGVNVTITNIPGTTKPKEIDPSQL